MRALGGRVGGLALLMALAACGTETGPEVSEDPALLDRIVEAGVALEVCPVSNVALGVYSDLTSVPLPELMAAGATIALGADDPLLFGSQLAGQYATMRAAHDLTDEQLADLAAMSIRASRAPDDLKTRLTADVDKWLKPESETAQ
jgi:adenosine deaminase